MIRYLLFLGDGPVTPERLVTEMRWTAAEGGAFFQVADLLIDAEGTIQTVAWAGCALDSLLLPLLTGRATHVASTCPATQRPIRLTVTPQCIEDLDPPETRPEDVQETICACGHFFADREHASRWPTLHPEALLLSVADATQLAREIANAARAYAESAQLRAADQRSCLCPQPASGWGHGRGG
jgi:alkylmercury lyase-like protein